MIINSKRKQGGMNLDLVLYKVDKVEDVQFENKIDNITLAGSLTMSQEGGNFSAVIMITGSGGQNRNEELLGHKPFLAIANCPTLIIL